MSGSEVAGQEWSARRYAETAHFVPALGAPVLELLAPSAGERILERIKEKEGDFDAGRPADALLRLRDKLLPPLRATTRARFEELFRRINKTL